MENEGTMTSDERQIAEREEFRFDTEKLSCNKVNFLFVASLLRKTIRDPFIARL